ncbi:hypothetical protein EJB05_53632, partial [Eragrostis curvula]
MVRMAGVGPEWSHSMAHALALDARTWPRGDVPGLGLMDEDVDLLRGRHAGRRRLRSVVAVNQALPSQGSKELAKPVTIVFSSWKTGPRRDPRHLDDPKEELASEAAALSLTKHAGNHDSSSLSPRSLGNPFSDELRTIMTSR